MPRSRRPAAPGARLARTLARHGSAQDVQRRLEAGIAGHIVLVKTHDQLGDFLVATPAFAALRARFPRARLTLVTRPYLAPLALRQPVLDEVLVLEPLGSLGGLARAIALLGRLRTPPPDAAFALNSVSRSRTADLVAALSGAALIVGRSRVGAGPSDPAAPDDGPDGLYDLDLDIAPGSIHQVDRLLDLVRWTGASAANPRMTLDASGTARGGVGLHPAAANALKCWPVGRFAELGARLASQGHALEVFDTPKEPGPARELLQALVARGASAQLVSAGPLDAFLPRVAGLDLMICNDSGVMHIAAALGVPTLSFHSLGRPEEWAPRNEKAIGLHAEPIAGISVDDAERAVSKLLKR